jgi:Mn2+/Fe2+ NRAMP family transporter
MGVAEVCVKITGIGEPRLWAGLMSVLAFVSVWQPMYRRVEKVILILAALLVVSLLGLALAVRPSPLELVKGIVGFQIPQTIGRFDGLFIAVSMVGAVGGGLANLMYPYFIREKGWVGAEHRRLQQYDLIFGIVVLIVLDLAVWTVGAEILHPRGIHVVDLSSLAHLLGESLGFLGIRIFYLGIFVALFTSIVGNGAAYGYIISDSFILTRRHKNTQARDSSYRWIAAWVTLSPLPWVVFGESDFVGVTIIVNAAQVVVIPVLVFGIWMITARAKHIGREHRNNRLENVFISIMMIFGCWAAWFSLDRIFNIIVGR